jgi:hypothetical protein
MTKSARLKDGILRTEYRKASKKKVKLYFQNFMAKQLQTIRNLKYSSGHFLVSRLPMVLALILVLVRSIPEDRSVLTLASGSTDNIMVRRWSSSVASVSGHLGLLTLLSLGTNFFGISCEIESSPRFQPILVRQNRTTQSEI